MAKLGELVRKKWNGIARAELKPPQLSENAGAVDRLILHGRVVVDHQSGKPDCLGEAFKPVVAPPWPAEACRAVRELKTSVADLEAENVFLRNKCSALERRVPRETSDAACRLLDEARCVLDEAKAHKSEFLRTVSHELLTLLNGAQGMLQALGETDLGTEQREYVELGLSACGVLERKLRALLEYRDMHCGCIALKRAPLRMTDILADVEMAHGPACKEKGLELVVRCRPAVPDQLLGDADRLRQILFHLVDNAVRFTRCGEVRVEADTVSEPRDNLVRLCLTVRDTGAGIPERRLERVLEPFVQAETGLNRCSNGLGLGLALVRKLAGLMDGHVHLESMEEVFTTARCVVVLEQQLDALSTE